MEQQTAIKTCVAAARVKDKRSIRYSIQWIYECLLLRIKSKKAYDHLRNHKILALPTCKTLMKYIRKIYGSYGFLQNTFTCLEKKASLMDATDRRGKNLIKKIQHLLYELHVCIYLNFFFFGPFLGVLLIDEMQLAKSLNFSQKDLKIYGFADLGIYTPEEQKDKLGDHVLVFMFQPFRGKWVQALGCFLSKGAASVGWIFMAQGP